MKEDVLRFRKCVNILIEEKGYSKNKIVLESKLSWPTFQKVMNDDIDTLKIMPSILGLIQDYIKKHCNDLNYAGIKPAPEAVQEMKKSLSNYKEPEEPVKEKENKVRIKVKPEALEKRQKQLAERKQEPQRASRGQMIDMLIKEKTMLKNKIYAIDFLLKHYISE